jgi:pimeloyl-ACP methyl ester carboxylesterase
VVLESGIASTSLAWALVQPRIAEFTRVVSYDRAGLGWSARCQAPRQVETMISELATLLGSANIPPPYILVGHSFGGLLIRAFAHLRPQEVAGLVFVDPVCVSCWAHCAPNEMRRLRYGAQFSRRGALLARLGIVRAALAMLAAGGRRLPKLIAKASAPHATGVMSDLVGQVQKLPPALWPIVRSHWSNSKCFRSMAAHLECLPGAARTVLQMPIPEEVPFLILSASNAKAAELEERDGLAQKNSRGSHLKIENAGHWIQLERPDAVIDAVRTLISRDSDKTLIDGAKGWE